MLLAALLGALSVSSAAAVNSPRDGSGASLNVDFNSVQLDTNYPEAFAFGVSVTAAPGFSITSLHWDFGDGSTLDVPYCCQTQVSEVRYHAYQQPGTYNVFVLAYDSGGNIGQALVTVNWPTPVPEFSDLSIPLLVSLLAVLMTLTFVRGKRLNLRILLR